jgi:hypothetical protein
MMLRTKERWKQLFAGISLFAVLSVALAAMSIIQVGSGKLYGCDAQANSSPCYTDNVWTVPDPSTFICSYDAGESRYPNRQTCYSQITPDRKGISVHCGAVPYSCGFLANCGASAKFILHSVTVGGSTDINNSCSPVITDIAKVLP